MKSLILLGYGKMARALALGLKGKFALYVGGRDFHKIQEFCKELQLSVLPQTNNTIDIEGKEILLCVKPYALGQFRFVGKAKCVYSILNAVSLETLKESIQSQNYIRAMPNVAASVGKSIKITVPVLILFSLLIA